MDFLSFWVKFLVVSGYLLPPAHLAEAVRAGRQRGTVTAPSHLSRPISADSDHP